MPIRLNLFAEDQAIEAQRRRDPVKRAVLAGVVLVAAMLVWSSTLMFKAMAARSELSAAETTINSQTNDFTKVVNDEKRLADSKGKLRALHVLVTNRFLNGNLLDVLQRTVVDNVQVTRLKVTQTYIYNEEIKPKDEEDKRAPKPASVTEKTMLSLNAMDTSVNGEAATRFQNALSAAPYFKTLLAKTNGFRLTSIGAPQTDVSGQNYTVFTLEAHLPEKTR
jgi:hypothetical protein